VAILSFFEHGGDWRGPGPGKIRRGHLLETGGPLGGPLQKSVIIIGVGRWAELLRERPEDCRVDLGVKMTSREELQCLGTYSFSRRNEEETAAELTKRRLISRSLRRVRSCRSITKEGRTARDSNLVDLAPPARKGEKGGPILRKGESKRERPHVVLMTVRGTLRPSKIRPEQDDGEGKRS